MSTSLSYDDYGQSDHALLLIHGHPFDRRMWLSQARVAAEAGWRVIVPDLRGYGVSPVEAGSVTLQAHAADMVGLLDKIEIDRAVVCGLSMGGQIAMAIVDLYPDRVRGLVLAATFPRPETADGRSARYVTADRIEREGMSMLADELLPKMLSPGSLLALPQAAGLVLEMMRSTPPQGAAASLRGRAERPDYTPVLTAYDGPALVIVGDEDAYTTAADRAAMRHALPHAHFLELPDVGHLPNLEKPERFNRSLVDLLDRVRDTEKR